MSLHCFWRLHEKRSSERRSPFAAPTTAASCAPFESSTVGGSPTKTFELEPEALRTLPKTGSDWGTIFNGELSTAPTCIDVDGIQVTVQLFASSHTTDLIRHSIHFNWFAGTPQICHQVQIEVESERRGVVLKYKGTLGLRWGHGPLEWIPISPKNFGNGDQGQNMTTVDGIRHANAIVAKYWYSTLRKKAAGWKKYKEVVAKLRPQIGDLLCDDMTHLYDQS
jgi:hypothetical protein